MNTDLELMQVNMKYAQPTSQPDMQVVKQLADMKDQTEYMKQFRVALGSALDEVTTLRTELALERTKGFEALKTTHTHQKRSPQNHLQLDTTILTTQSNSGDNSMSWVEMDMPDGYEAEDTGPDVHKDISLVIAESADRIDRVRDAVVAKKHLISDLRKKLQASTSTLIRRETKLEEKLNRECELKNELKTLGAQHDQFKLLAEVKIKQFDDELKKSDAYTHTLLQKLSFQEAELNKLAGLLCKRDMELDETRNRMFYYRGSTQQCRECAHMKEYIRNLEHELSQYRYHRQSSYNRWWNSKLSYKGYHENKSQNPHNPRSYNTQYNGEQVRNTDQRCNRSRSHANINTAEVYKRQQLANRQRHEFRNASQALSPITEDTEESVPSINFTRESKPDSNQASTSKCEKLNCNKKFVSYNYPPSSSSLLPTSIGDPSGNNVGALSLRNSELNIPKSTSVSLNISAEVRKNSDESTNNVLVATSHHNITPMDTLLTPNDLSKVNPSTQQISIDLNKTTESLVESSTLHGTSMKAFHSHPDVKDVKDVECSLPSLQSFPILSSTFSSTPVTGRSATEDNTSDASGYSFSDSGFLPHRSKSQKRLVKTRRSSKRRSQKFIRFRGHTIDVTQFSMPEFRQIMWSLCTEDKAADEFLDLLASEASRLQKDSFWADKHTLGDPDDWLKLKGSY